MIFKRLGIGTAFVAALLFSWPAQGMAKTPEASGFSQELRGVERTGVITDDGDAVQRSRVLSAPRRFDLAGLGGELRGVDLRAREAGGEWTDWTHTANGDPVWFGGMDQLQVRTHGWQPSGSVDYVDVTQPGSAPSPSSRRVDSERPDVISRRAWGANKKGKKGCRPRRDPDIGVVKAAIVHHTVSAVNYSESEAKGMVLGICQFHRNDNGWDDIGYNALVDRFGNIYEGREGGLGEAVQGAQAEGVNSQTTGVAVLGTYSSQQISADAFNALADWFAWKLPKHGLDTTGKAKLVSAGGSTAIHPNGEHFKTKRIIGHRKTNFTECPGDALYGQLSDLREKVQKKIDKND